VARNLGRDMVVRLNDFATGGLRPDVTILLDVDPAVGLARQKDGNRMEQESLAFHNLVRQGFLQEAKKEPARFIVVNGAAPVEKLHAEIDTRVKMALRSRA
ncbi:MAG TPA: dTMP kinase, partial [Chthonomonadales bacterium]|nr:dTMP kinase [Chthonomonadales bacterium]